MRIVFPLIFSLLIIGNPVVGQINFTSAYYSNWGISEINTCKIYQKRDHGFLITALPQSSSEPHTFIGSTDSSGNVLWGGIYSDGQVYNSSFYVTNVIETNYGGALLAGTYDTTSAGLDSMHFVLIRLDSLGNIMWEKSLHQANAFTDEKFTCIIQGFDAGFIIVGNLGIIIKTDSIGNIQWTKSIGYYTFNKLIPVSNQNYLALVNPNTIIKFDSAFNVIWSKNYLPPGIILTSAIETIDGSYSAVGLLDSTGISSNGSLFMLKIDSNGNLVYALKSDSTFISRLECPANIVQMPDSQLVLLCTVIDSGDESNLILRLDLNGNIIRSRIWNSFGNFFHARNSDLIKTANGGYAFLMKFTYSASADTELRIALFNSEDSTACGTRPFLFSWISDSVTVSNQNFAAQSINLVETNRLSFNSGTTHNQFFCAQPDHVGDLKNQPDFSVSPNPFYLNLTLHLKEHQDEKAQLSIINSIGEIVWEKEIKLEDQSLVLTSLPHGIYLVCVKTDKDIYREKIIHE